jgi:hypothetical protein
LLRGDDFFVFFNTLPLRTHGILASEDCMAYSARGGR